MRTKLSFILLLAIGLCFSQASFSQSPIHIGVKAGANFTDISTSLSDYSTKSATGFTGGATIRVDIKKAYLQADLMYAEKNTKFESTTNLGTDNTKWKNLEVPLVVGYKLIDLSVFNLRAYAGGVYTKIITDDISSRQVGNVFEDFDKDNLGYRVGLGVDVLKFSLDVSYDSGFKNISNNFKSKPNTITATLGFFIL